MAKNAVLNSGKTLAIEDLYWHHESSKGLSEQITLPEEIVLLIQIQGILDMQLLPNARLSPYTACFALSSNRPNPSHFHQV